MSCPNPLGSLRRDARGSTAVEYAVLAAVVAIVAIGALRAFAGASLDLWTLVEQTVIGAVGD